MTLLSFDPIFLFQFKLDFFPFKSIRRIENQLGEFKLSECKEVGILFFQVPGLGHIPNLVKSMSSSNDAVVKSAIQVVHLLSANEVRLDGQSLVSIAQTAGRHISDGYIR